MGELVFFDNLFIVLYFYVIGKEIFDYSLIVPISLLLIVGLYDDIYEVDFKLKFFSSNCC